MTSLKNVADAAGVSVATVSLVRSGKSKGRVSSGTEERVQQIAADMDYVGNAAAQSLRTRKTNTIGFLSDLIASTPFALEMIAGANRAAMEADQLLMLFNTEGELKNEKAAVSEFLRHGIKKTIVASMFHREVRPPKKLLPNLMILDGYAADSSIRAIVPDEQQGVRDAMRHLFDLGHRRIGYLGDVTREGAAPLLRREAYLECVEQLGLDSDRALVVESTQKLKEAQKRALELL